MVQIHGHRGCRGIYPENTLLGFIHAIELGVHAIELDVVVTKEKELLVSHEPYMGSHLCLKPDGSSIMFDEEFKYNLFKMRYQDIVLYDCGSILQTNFPNQFLEQSHKPLLKDVCKLIKPLIKNDFILNIEIKSERQWYGDFQPEITEYANIIMHFLKTTEFPVENIMIQSFDPAILNRLYTLNPDLILGYLVEEKINFEKQMDRLIFTPNYFNPEYILVDEKLVQKVHDHGMKILCWTVNDKETGSQLIDWGVDGIISDYPHLFL